jgi:hypothetical protein
LTIVGEGGTTSVSYAQSLAISVVYVVIAAVLTTVAFTRRDVTA